MSGHYGDRGERGITMFDAAWSRIIEQRPDFNTIDLFYSFIWGSDINSTIRRGDHSRIKLVSLMRHFAWVPKEVFRSKKEIAAMGHSQWGRVISSMNDGQLEAFVQFASDVTLGLTTSDGEYLPLLKDPVPDERLLRPAVKAPIIPKPAYLPNPPAPLPPPIISKEPVNSQWGTW